MFLNYSHLGPHKKEIIGKMVASIISPFLGPNSKVHSGVTDGGEITSIKHTANAIPRSQQVRGSIQERLCLCHRLNNAIKQLLQDYFGETYLVQWRSFISRINSSNPFNELFEFCKKKELGENCKTKLQRDCDTR
jgi:hypothetical protein